MARRIAKDLPFDVLVLIFEQYVSEETPNYPTENLLLVCKSWSRAALDHSRLWSKLNIHSDDFPYWCTCIPGRLKRCSTNTLLDIKITFGTTRLMYQSVLSLLAGNDGDIAQRWRKFEIRGRNGDKKHHQLAKFLCFPTPDLCELTLVDVDIYSELIFPATPALKVVSVFNCNIDAIPDTSSLSEMDVSADLYFEKHLPRAFNLAKLHIYAAYDEAYSLYSTLRNLTSLRLSDILREGALEGFSAPALQELHLDFGYGSEFSCVVGCKGIPLSRLSEISLGSPQRTLETNLIAYRDGLREFLCAATHIKVLRLIDWVSAALVLGLLTSDCESLYQEHPVLVNSGGHEIELGQGEDRLSSVNKLRDVTQGISGRRHLQTSRTSSTRIAQQGHA